MGGKGKLPVASLNKPGQGEQEAHLRETLSRFSEGRFEAPFPCSFHPRSEAATAGRGAVGTESRGSRRRRRRPDRSSEPEGERGPEAAAVVRAAEKPGTTWAAAATCLSRSAGRGSGCAPAKPVLGRGLEVPTSKVPTADP